MINMSAMVLFTLLTLFAVRIGLKGSHQTHRTCHPTFRLAMSELMGPPTTSLELRQCNTWQPQSPEYIVQISPCGVTACWRSFLIVTAGAVAVPLLHKHYQDAYLYI